MAKRYEKFGKLRFAISSGARRLRNVRGIDRGSCKVNGATAVSYVRLELNSLILLKSSRANRAILLNSSRKSRGGSRSDRLASRRSVFHEEFARGQERVPRRESIKTDLRARYLMSMFLIETIPPARLLIRELCNR